MRRALRVRYARINKRAANVVKAKQDLSDNKKAIAAKKKDMPKAKGKDAKQKAKDEVEVLKVQRKKLKEALARAHHDPEVLRLKAELKANKAAIKQKKTDHDNKQPLPVRYIIGNAAVVGT